MDERQRGISVFSSEYQKHMKLKQWNDPHTVSKGSVCWIGQPVMPAPAFYDVKCSVYQSVRLGTKNQ